jgi:hypothetical protein
LLASFAGVLIVMVEGVQQLLHTHENWIRYRSTAESLRRESFAFASRLDGYDARDKVVRQTLLARNIQAILQNESRTWTELRGRDTPPLPG